MNARVEALGILLAHFSTLGMSSYNEENPTSVNALNHRSVGIRWAREMKAPAPALLTLHLWGQDCSSEAGSGASQWAALAVRIQIEHPGVLPCCGTGLRDAQGLSSPVGHY